MHTTFRTVYTSIFLGLLLFLLGGGYLVQGKQLPQKLPDRERISEDNFAPQPLPAGEPPSPDTILMTTNSPVPIPTYQPPQEPALVGDTKKLPIMTTPTVTPSEITETSPTTPAAEKQIPDKENLSDTSKPVPPSGVNSSTEDFFFTLPTPLPLSNQSYINSPNPNGWVTIMTENFEGIWPSGAWFTFDNDGSTNGDYCWDDDDYLPHGGSWSAWAANGCANGLDPASYYYPNYADSWAVYGPFDLGDANDAEFLFWYWNQSELYYDYFGWYASGDGANFGGTRVSGDSGGWQYINFDLTNVPNIGNLAGDSSVWIALIFTSDGSNVDDGPFVDDNTLQKNSIAQPNLVPYQPSGWDGSIVASSTSGTHTSDTLYAGGTTYIDWAVANYGASTSTTFYTDLYFDDNYVARWSTSGLSSGYYTYVEDYILPLSPTVGWHTLKIVTDVTNAVSESDESDNIYERSFYWNASLCGPYGSLSPLAIPDNGSWVEVPLVDKSAPVNSTVTEINVKYRIDYPDPSQLEIRLKKVGSDIEEILWDPKAPAERYSLGTALGIKTFNGTPSQDEWRLMIRILNPGQQGWITAVSIRALYAPVGPLPQVIVGDPGQPTSLSLPPGILVSRSNDADSTRPDSANQGISSQKPESWQVIKSEDFEGAFPNSGWTLLDVNDDGCEFLWDDDDFRSHNGSWAAWPANGGANGLDPATSNYPPNMNSWMIYGPFDLSDATDADTLFWMWREIETDFDAVFFGVSTDGTSFNGVSWDGSAGWEQWQINYASYVGNSSVWVAWVFQSDGSVQYEGPWIDDIQIRKDTASLDCGTILAAFDRQLGGTTLLAKDHLPPNLMPPNPNLLERVRRGEIVLPDFITNPTLRQQRGIDQPRTPVSQPQGQWRALALLVQFTDNPSQVGASYFDSLLFDNSTGTLTDYYNEVSYGILDIVTVNLPSRLLNML